MGVLVGLARLRRGTISVSVSESPKEISGIFLDDGDLIGG